MFGTPSAGANGPRMNELENRLVLIYVLSVERGIATVNGISDALKVNLLALDNGDKHAEMFLWGRKLVGQLTPGVAYVGRIAKGQAQPGKSAPWTFFDGTEAEKQSAASHLQSVLPATIASPSVPAQPGVAPVAQPSAAPQVAAQSGTATPPWM